MNGVLLLDKPAGPTSHDMVDLVRRLAKTRKVGHAGTLDPFATGLLVLLIGSLTKISSFLLNQNKTYLATIAMGAATDTLDHTGKIVETGEKKAPAADVIEQAFSRYLGSSYQKPPMYSAKKLNGQPLYRAARRGEELEREAKKVHVYTLDLLEVGPDTFTVRVECSKGTYVRVLADSLARELGGVGHLQSLRRERSGHFRIEEAYQPAKLSELAEDGSLDKALISLEIALSNYREVTLAPPACDRLKSGLPPTGPAIVKADSFQQGETLRLTSQDGRLLAMARARVDAARLNGQIEGSSPFELLRVFASSEDVK